MKINSFAQTILARRILIARVIILSGLAIQTCFSQSSITLKNSFIRKYKDRATIQLNYRIDHVKKSINTISSGGDDGDLHTSGRPSLEVGLPMVAEIINAANEPEAVKFVRKNEATDRSVKLTGVWRLWFEHPPKDAIIQGSPVPKPSNTNPDHVFEIHPVTALDSLDLDDGITLISGYEAYTTDDAVHEYKSKRCEILASRTTTKITTKKIGYNYVQLIMRLEAEPVRSEDDGTFVLAEILDKHGEPVDDQIRMVFPPSTDAEDKIRTKRKGDEMEILGIPRINLHEIYERARAARRNANPFEENLPYEIIVIGVFDNPALPENHDSEE